MIHKLRLIVPVTAAVLVVSAMFSAASAAEGQNEAFAALEKYDWGGDRAVLVPIDKAVAVSFDNDLEQRELAKRLSAVLSSNAPDAAKDYACRKLSLVGSSGCVTTVSSLLTNEKLSHMARYALERIPDAAAVSAMREALPDVDGRLKVGVINSLGVRRDAEAVPELVKLLEAGDKQVVAAAAMALGSIGNSDAAKALGTFQKKAPAALRLAAADAYLSCAERLLADGKKMEAMAAYKSLDTDDQAKHVRSAAKRGLLATLQN